MTDTKITGLTALTTPTDDDVMPIVDDPGGTPITKKVTWANLKATLKTYFDTLYSSVVKAAYTDVATGTDDAKYVTSLAIKNSVNVPNVAPSTSGKLLTSNGTNWTSATLAETQISSAVAPSTSGNVLTSNGSAWTSTAPVVTASTTNTFTNKRITKRVGTVASNATPTIDTDSYDIFTITALATGITSMTTNLGGTPTAGQQLIIRIYAAGTQSISWGAKFASRGATLPISTVAGKYIYVGLIWNDQPGTPIWDCIAVATEA